MNATEGEWNNSRRLAALFCVGFTGMSIFFDFSRNYYDDYYRAFGFHLSKRELNSLTYILAMAMARVWLPAYIPIPAKKNKTSWLACAGIWCFFLALPIPSLISGWSRTTPQSIPAQHLGAISPLMMAANEGDLREMERLIKSGVDLNARNNIDNTALHFAAGAFPVQNRTYRGSPSAVTYLVEHGADLNAQDGAGNTPLIDAVMNNNVESAKILMAHGADVNKESKYHETALSIAVMMATPVMGIKGLKPLSAGRDMVIELLQHGANPNAGDIPSNTSVMLTPLQMAERRHEDDLVKELKDHGAKK